MSSGIANDDITKASREQWSGSVAGWAREAEIREAGPAGAAADWMLTAVALEPGQRVLDVACGAGELGLRAAELVGPTGKVLCTDFAAPMVELVQQRAGDAGLEHVEARVANAEALELSDERFDAVLCRFGYMLMAHPDRALAARAAALDRGGRLALAVWGAPERNPWLSLITAAVMDALSAPPPAADAPGPFALSQDSTP
jgi:ubiquinone/menaquinone biosynthesis C-methylase UbiE